MKLNYTMAKEFPLKCVVGVDFVLWLRYETQRKDWEEIPTLTPQKCWHNKQNVVCSSFLDLYSTEKSRKQNAFFWSN